MGAGGSKVLQVKAVSRDSSACPFIPPTALRCGDTLGPEKSGTPRRSDHRGQAGRADRASTPVSLLPNPHTEATEFSPSLTALPHFPD